MKSSGFHDFDKLLIITLRITRGRSGEGDTLHEELSGARRRRIKIALQKDTTREVLEGWQALEGWLP